MQDTALDAAAVGPVLEALAPAAELYLSLSPRPSFSVVDNPTGFALLAERALQDAIDRRDYRPDPLREALAAIRAGLEQLERALP